MQAALDRLVRTDSRIQLLAPKTVRDASRRLGIGYYDTAIRDEDLTEDRVSGELFELLDEFTKAARHNLGVD